MKGCDIIVKILIAKGVDTIFGYPGGYILDIYHALSHRNDAIRHVLLGSEQSCVFAADGYARHSGRLGVVLATSGPGACNLVTGIACANADSVPLLAITGNVPTHKLGSDSFQEVDIFGVTMPITKHNQMVKSIDELIPKLCEAIYLATHGRHGATLIDIPEDIQSADLDITDHDLIGMIENRATYNLTPPCDISRAASLINGSHRVSILVGGGCGGSNASRLAVELSQHLNAPVATTLMGVANFPSDNDYYCGLSGSHGNPTANHALKVSDTIVTLGARFGDRLISAGSLSGKNIIQIDIDRSEYDKNISAVCFLHGDIESTLSRLLPAIQPKGSDFIQSVHSYRRKNGVGDSHRGLRNIHKVLSAKLGDGGIVSTDVGNHQLHALRNYCYSGSLLTSSGLGAMGYGLPAIIGASFCTKTPQKSLLITGDGSLNMSAMELSMVAKLNLPLVIALFNNHTLGMCKDAQTDKYNNVFMTDTPVDINYIALSQALGVRAVKVKDAYTLGKVLAGYDYTHPLLVEIECDI